METKRILEKAITIIEGERKWLMLEGSFLEKLKKAIHKKNKGRAHTYSNACSRTIRKEHRFEKELIDLLDILKETHPEWYESINKLEEQIKLYENNVLLRVSKPFFGEKGKIPTLLNQRDMNWNQLGIEADEAYSKGVQQLIALMDNLKSEFEERLHEMNMYIYTQPGKGKGGTYIRLNQLIQKRSLMSNKVKVEIKGNNIVRDSRPVQGCLLKGNYVEFVGYHFTNKNIADIIKKDEEFIIKTATDPYIYFLEPLDYSGRSEKEIRHLAGSKSATDVLIAKIVYPLRRIWMKFEKNRPTHFAVEGDVTQSNLIKRKGFYVLRKDIKEL